MTDTEFNSIINRLNEKSYIYLFGNYDFIDNTEELTEGEIDELPAYAKNECSGSWSSDCASYLKYSNLDNIRRTFTNDKILCFDPLSSLSEKQYPMVVCGILKDSTINEEGIPEVSEVPIWALIDSKDELAQWKEFFNISSVQYMFDIDSNIYPKIASEVEKCSNMVKEEREARTMRTIHLQGDVLITDPSYFIEEDDWGRFPWDYSTVPFGINESICRDTLCGEWTCSLIDEFGAVMGGFTSHSGYVCVCLLDEAYKYSDDLIDQFIEYGNAAVVKNFDGDINFVIEDDQLKVVADGNKKFTSEQQ